MKKGQSRILILFLLNALELLSLSIVRHMAILYDFK